MVDIEDAAREIWQAMEGISDGDGQAILRDVLAEAWDEGATEDREALPDNPYRDHDPSEPACDCGTCMAIARAAVEADREARHG